MRKALGVLICLIVVAGCGSSGSSGLSESEANELVDSRTAVDTATCVRTKNGDDRDFTCNALNGRNEVTVEVIVGEDGKSVVVARCEAEESIYGDSCEGLGG